MSKIIETTQAQFDRTHKMFCDISKENGTTELVGGCFYFFSSELATLRLINKYRNIKEARCGYSTNLNSHFFSLEGDFSGSFTTDWHK